MIGFRGEEGIWGVRGNKSFSENHIFLNTPTPLYSYPLIPLPL
ncbi:hypothetical protein NIES4106_09250 [Fischerella sp. NIES-4106]|jgi:hypothetical protein|nr:hypothetical protein NIES4106_09250 [Fischerella sp. NIES-4106]